MSSGAEKKFLKELDRLVQGDLKPFTPGLQLQAYQGGRLKLDIRKGQNFPYYDLASLTKIMFTTSAYMRWASDGKLKATDSLSQHWWEWRHRRVHLRDLFSHSAGMPWWLPMYKKLRGPMVPESRWLQAEKHLLKVKPERHKRSLYSDIDLWLLGAGMVHSRDRDLLEIWRELSQPWGFESLHFNPGNRPRYKRKFYAPTESCLWRKKIMRGEVHDENTWAMGGVAPHAGLFGRIEDVSSWGLELRKGLHSLKGSKLGSHSVIKSFTRRAIPPKVGDWATGFMMPTKGSASCGKYFSAQSIGHTGFTGTSLWYDPKADLLVVILSNRVHPTRKNQAFVKLRPQLHNAVYETLVK